MKAIKFIQNYGPYSEREVAFFPDETAQMLIEKKIAVKFIRPWTERFFLTKMLKKGK